MVDQNSQFPEVTSLVADIAGLRAKIAARATKSSVKLGNLYTSFDARVSSAETTLQKALDERALDVESAVRQLTNLGEQVSAAALDTSLDTSSSASQGVAAEQAPRFLNGGING